MDQLGFLAQHVFNRPLMIHPRKAEVATAALMEHLGLARPNFVRPAAFLGDDSDDAGFSRRGRVVQTDYGFDFLEGVAMIPIQGTLVQKLRTLRPYSGMTGYDGIRQAFSAAMGEDEVEAIVFDVDSPGGDVAALFDLVDTIYDCRGEKPIWGVLNETAYSAAYALASAVDPGRLIVPRTGGTGSIGVICMHVDFSQQLSDEGIKVTFIHRGAKKADGHEEFPLSESALADMQEEIDCMGELFEQAVARNRGLTAKAVFDLQAGTFLGAKGVARGLADHVMAPDAAFERVLAELA